MRTNAEHTIRGEPRLGKWWRRSSGWAPVRQMSLKTASTPSSQIGPGEVLSRLIRRISGDVKAISLNDAVVALLGPRDEPTTGK